MEYFGKTMLRSGLAAALFLSATQAQAATLVFTLTGSYNATWQLDSSPVISSFVPGSSFNVNSVPGTYGGVAQTASVLQFYTPAGLGGFSIGLSSGTAFVSSGPQLFSGTLSAPTFLTGTFALTQFTQLLPGSGTLTIAPLATAVPEPATWAMMFAGFGLIGGALRSRQTGRVRVTKLGYVR
jgi:hypothetical protein